MVWLTKLVVRGLQAVRRSLPSRQPGHLRTGKRGEVEAYLHLQRLGYCIIAENFRVPFNRGEIDLIGWDRGVLCFIEVKTRTRAEFAPPSTAVNLAKKLHILAVARRYLRRLPGDRPPLTRFDVVSVVPGQGGAKPQISLQKGAFGSSAGKPRNQWRRDFGERRHFGARRDFGTRRFWRPRG